MVQAARIIAREISELLEKGAYREIKEAVSSFHFADVVEILRELPDDKAVVFFRILPKDLAADVFAELEKDEQENLLRQLTDETLRGLINEMAPDDRTDLLEEMPANVVTRLISLLPVETRNRALELLRYPEDSAGRLMTTEYVAVRPDWTVQEVLNYLRKIEIDSETIYYIYVIDDERHLVGVLSLREVIFADPEARIKDIMHRDVIAAQTTQDQEEVVHLMKKYDLLALPVVDKENRLVGIITIDDAMDIQEEEATEDFQKMASMGTVEESYFHTSSWMLIRKRLGWLTALLLTESLTGTIMRQHENLLNTFVVLAFFIPTIIGTGGNTGTQSSTLVIRGLALGEIRPKEWLKVFLKEIFIGLILGLSMGLILALRVLVDGQGINIAVVVGLSVCAVILIANLFGALLPLLARALRLDPAVMAGPLIPTFVDITALWIYIQIARVILFPGSG